MRHVVKRPCLVPGSSTLPRGDWEKRKRGIIHLIICSWLECVLFGSAIQRKEPATFISVISLFRGHSYVQMCQSQAEELDKKLRHIVEDVPDRIYHIMGSCAGAGSGDFHTYRHSRRREQERLKRIREEDAKDTLNKEFKVSSDGWIDRLINAVL